MYTDSVQKLAALFIILTFGNQANANVSSQLLDAFSGQCPRVNNVIIDTARGNLLTLQQVIQDLQSDPECGALAYNLNNISILSRNINDFENEKSSKRDLIAEQKKIAFYNSLLVDDNFSDQSYDIKTDIINSQANAIQLKSNIGYYTKASNRHARNAMGAVNGIMDYLQQVQATPSCFKNRSLRLSSLIGQTLSVASVFMSPGAAVATSAAGILTQGVGLFIRNHKYKKLDSFFNSQQMGLAIECTLSALTSQYCEADNAMTLINKREEDRNSFIKITEQLKDGQKKSLEGIELLSKHLDNLDSWLIEVYAGSPISSEGDRINRERPMKQKNLLEEIDRSIDSFEVSQNEKIKILYSSSPSREQKRDFILQSIAKLNSKLLYAPGSMDGSSSIENPVQANNDDTTIAFYLFTGEMDRPFCGTDSNRHLCHKLDTWLKENPSIIVSIDHWRKSVERSKVLIKKEMNLVLLLLARVQNVSPIESLTNVTVKKNRRTSAYRALVKIRDNAQRISEYLDKHIQNDSDDIVFRAQRFKVDLTLLKTNKVISLVKQGLMIENSTEIELPRECIPEELDQENKLVSSDINTNKIKEAAYQILGCINKLLKLTERGSSAYFEEIRSMVRYEIDAKLEANELNEELNDFILMSREDVVSALLSTYGSEPSQNMDDVINSLLTAQELTVTSLENFFEKFSGHVADLIDSPKTSERLKNRLCIWILSKPDEKMSLLGMGKNRKKSHVTKKERSQIKRLSKTVRKSCQSAKVKSFYNIELEFNKLRSKSQNKRMCSFWRYYRQNDLKAIRVR